MNSKECRKTIVLLVLLGPDAVGSIVRAKRVATDNLCAKRTLLTIIWFMIPLRRRVKNNLVSVGE